MGVDLVRAQPEHVGELGRILYEAFKHIADKHHFPPFFPSVALAREVIGGLVQRTDIYGVAALVDSQPVGSNFLEVTDAAYHDIRDLRRCSCNASGPECSETQQR